MRAPLLLNPGLGSAVAFLHLFHLVHGRILRHLDQLQGAEDLFHELSGAAAVAGTRGPRPLFGSPDERGHTVGATNAFSCERRYGCAVGTSWPAPLEEYS